MEIVVHELGLMEAGAMVSGSPGALSRPRRFLASLTLVFLCWLTGCATLQSGQPAEEYPEVMIGGLAMFNHGQSWISAARVLVPATGQFVSCGNIAPGDRCATGFPEQRFSGNPIEITWSQGGAIHSTGELRLDLPEDAIESGHVRVRVYLMGPGSAAAEVVATPDPR